ncbi:uncharacterized protein LOC110025942 [Phalaenopsis equestris]|uniref:uncharacterized protein LOC110025942 n=1 Tax=Phalaenopsis equestris TaxID=78828 RepID=UPI0009E24D5F|nr:uncharacterized protein LOC110025942 [Phalaenopsis equestris]
MTSAYAADGFYPVEPSFASPCVSFPPSPSPLRLLTRFAEPHRPIISDHRQLDWIWLQSRSFGASEATSARAIGMGLGPEEAVVWKLFTPLQRVLLVALIAITSAERRRSQRILQLQLSVHIRDEMLKNMQLKHNDLLDQMTFMKDHSPTSGSNFQSKNEQVIVSEMVEKNKAKFFHGDCRAPYFNPDGGIVPLCHSQSIKTKDVCVTQSSKERLTENNYEILTEQEERRMSDLSDFCWSVASSVDTQPAELSTLAAEQELYNLRKEFEEKNATIRELTTAAHTSNVTYSKRITELEEVIRRKNMVITKLKKDMFVLEQQIVKFTRLRRPSSTPFASDSTTERPPLMTENILYDMSSSSTSSSDRDSPQRGGFGLNPSSNSSNGMKHGRLDITKVMGSSVSTLQEAMCPLRKNRVSRKLEANASVSSKQFASSITDEKKSRSRKPQAEMMTAKKKWI